MRPKRVPRVQGDDRAPVTREQDEARVSTARAIGLHPWHPVLLLLLAGCASNVPTSAGQVADSGAMQAGQTKPTPIPEAKPAGNPNRVYQLKDLKKVDLDLKGHPVHLWVMDDAAKQEEGMMFLTDSEVKPDEGMLFAFPTVQPKTREGGQPSGFWMRNTLIPLDIVYLSPEDKVIRIAQGKVQNDTNLPAGADYKNVIELKGGTAAKYGLKPGDTVAIPKSSSR